MLDGTERMTLQTTMKNSRRLSVSERVSAAIKMIRAENPSARLSVSEICRQARVSRANLYATHHHIVAEILNRAVDAPKPKIARDPYSGNLGMVKNAAISTREKALLYLCLELKTEVESLRALKRAAENARRVRTRRKDDR